MTFTIYSADLAPATAESISTDATLSFSPTAIVPVDKLACCLTVWDNVDGTSSNDTTLLTVTDTKSNTWLRAAEGQLSAGVAADGLLAGIFYTVVTTQLETTDTITITATANASRKGATLMAFNRNTSNTVAVAGKGYDRSAVTGAYSATVSGLASEEHAWVGQNAMEIASSNTNTKDTLFTPITQGTTAHWGTVVGGGAAVDVGARGGYLINTGTGETYDHAGPLQDADRVTILVGFVEVAPAGGTVSVSPMGTSGFFGA